MDFYQPIVEADIVCLTEIRIKRTSQYDSFCVQEILMQLQIALATTIHHLHNLKDYTIAWYENFLKNMERTEKEKPF
jgi:hypothetical protein